MTPDELKLATYTADCLSAPGVVPSAAELQILCGHVRNLAAELATAAERERVLREACQELIEALNEIAPDEEPEEWPAVKDARAALSAAPVVSREAAYREALRIAIPMIEELIASAPFVAGWPAADLKRIDAHLEPVGGRPT